MLWWHNSCVDSVCQYVKKTNKYKQAKVLTQLNIQTFSDISYAPMVYRMFLLGDDENEVLREVGSRNYSSH